MSFWEGKAIPPSYVGIDISEAVITSNKRRSGARFICSSADTYIELPKARIVLCLDVLFHIMDERTYLGTLMNLTRYSNEWIFVYTWTKNPFESLKMRLNLSMVSLSQGRIVDAFMRLGDKSSDGLYEKYRNYGEYLFLFERAGFSLRSRECEETNKFGSMHVFERDST